METQLKEPGFDDFIKFYYASKNHTQDYYSNQPQKG